MTCRVCNKKLNISVRARINNNEYKSCPKCSVLNGNEHVFSAYPEGFGVTKRRITTNNKDGIQSYCLKHRGNDYNDSIPFGTVLCSNVDDRS